MSKTKTELVIEAAEGLAAEGINPTMQAVRDRMGGGSFATIGPVLRDWKARHKAEVVQTEQAPPEAVEAGTRAAATIWAVAMQTAAERIEDAERRSEERASEAERERDEALSEIARLEAENQAAQVRTEQSRGNLEREGQAHAETRTALAKAEAQADERGKRTAALSDELAGVRKESEAQARQAIEAEAEVRRLAGALEEQGLALVSAEAAEAAETLRADKAEASAEQARTHAADLEAEIKELRSEATVNGKELATVTANAEAGKRELAQALARATEAQQREREAIEAAAELRGKLAALEPAVTTRQRKSVGTTADDKG